jgi:hypothetical protein
MAITERYMNTDLTTGANDGTSEADAWQTWAAAAAGLAADQRLNVKAPASRTSVVGAATFSVNGSGATPIAIRAYSSTIGDGGVAQYEDLTINLDGDNYLCEGIDIDGPGNVAWAIIACGGANVTLYNCRGTKVGASGTAQPRIFQGHADGFNCINCYAEVDGGTWANAGSNIITGTCGTIAYNVVKFGADYRFPYDYQIKAITCDCATGNNVVVHRNIVYSEATGVFNISGVHVNQLHISSDGFSISHNTIYNVAVGVYVAYTGSSATDSSNIIVNNCIVGCRDAVIGTDDNVGTPAIFVLNNATDGLISGPGLIHLSTLRLTQDPFTDASSADFSLNSTAGGGAVCRARALSATGGFPDVGALQA